MRKLKHNKLKNTGLLFEILSRAMLHETLHPDKPQAAAKIIKQHFTSTSELLKELRLYNMLSNQSEHEPSELLKLVMESRSRLNDKVLLREKYDLVRSIKNKYDLEVLFNTRVSNYKLQASIFKLFEYSGVDNPDEYLSTKKLIIESLSGKIAQQNVINEVEQAWRKEDPDTRKLGFKIIVERFNEKYRSLGNRQKKMLSKYINDDTSSPEFKDYVIRECGYIGKQLTNAIDGVDDPVVKIKLTETVNLMQSILTSSIIKEEHLSAIMKYYELIKEIENA